MKRRQFLKRITIAGAALGVPFPTTAEVEDRLEGLLGSAAFVNASDLTTIGSLPGYRSDPGFNDDYLAQLKQGGVSVVSASMVFWLYDEFDAIGQRVRDFQELFSRHPDDLRMARSWSDIESALRDRKIAVLMHAHTPSVIGGDLRRLEVLFHSGLRILGFSHQQNSLLAEGAGEDLDSGDGGLSRFGVAVLRELNRLHMIADLGHASDRSIIEAAGLSSDPIIVSHTCVRSLVEHRSRSLHFRNISDEAIRAVAANGGVIGIMALTPHLIATGSVTRPTLSVYLDHVEHVIKTAGIDHVGIGTETSYGGGAADMKHLMTGITAQLGANTPVTDTFAAVAGLPPGTALVVPGMEDMSRIKYNLIEAMIARGWSDNEIERVLGLNFLDVYRKVLPA